MRPNVVEITIEELPGVARHDTKHSMEHCGTLHNVRRRRLNALLYVVLTACLVTVGHAAAAAELRGTIVDEMGAHMWASYVVIRKDSAGSTTTSKSTLRTLTPKDGTFSADLEPGFYDICVMSDGFQPVCKKVKIVDEKATGQRFILKVDPEVTDKLWDRIAAPERWERK
jgi:hypothetical protein